MTDKSLTSALYLFSNKKTALKDDDTQLMIDAGQKEFGVRHCPSCGLVFEVGNTTDETSHKEYHDHLFTALKHNVSVQSTKGM